MTPADFYVPTGKSGENHLCEVGSPMAVVSVTPVISSSPAYTSGDAVGGEQKLTGACRVTGGKAILQTITIQDVANQKAALTILFFDSEPTGATITDNSAFAWGSTAFAKVVGKIDVAAGDYETVASKAVAAKTALGLEMQAAGAPDLWAVVVTTGTPTYTTASDLTFKYGFQQS